MIIKLTPESRFRAKIQVPGDKSISHRFLMFNAIASGAAEGRGLLLGLDCLSTADCLRALGVNIDQAGDRTIVNGLGLRGLRPSAGPLDVGNSGTTIRMLPGILVGQDFKSTLTGDDSIRRRPMDRIVNPLRSMNANITAVEQGHFAPLEIEPSPSLTGISYAMPIASAQVKSCLLLAGLYATGETIVTEASPSRDHSERMLKAMGAECDFDGTSASVKTAQNLEPLSMRIPGDISSAAFWMIAATIMPDADIIIENVGLNRTRAGVIDVLLSMGADIEIAVNGDEALEPIGDIKIRSSALRGVSIGMPLIPSVIDELPILAVAASQAEGDTIVTGAAELRVKEVDRITILVKQLRRLGVDIDECQDGFAIHGPCRLSGAVVDSCGDHRLAMSLAIAALRAEGETTIVNAEAAAISYPDFWSRFSEYIKQVNDGR